jgi:hypothetical protein
MRTDTVDRVRENRMRRAAERRGLVLRRSPRKDASAPDYGGYQICDKHDGRIRLGGSDYAATLDDVAIFFNDDVGRPGRCVAPFVHTVNSFVYAEPPYADQGRKIDREYSALIRNAMASAKRHEAQRERDRDGRLIATLDDYEVALAKAPEAMFPSRAEVEAEIEAEAQRIAAFSAERDRPK